MSGNVSEWCSDWYTAGYYKNSPTNNTQGAQKGSPKLVLRGGNFSLKPTYCRNAYRSFSIASRKDNTFGFRLAQ